MRIRHIRSPLLALVVAAAFGTACHPVQVMTNDQVMALARSAAGKDAAALALLKAAARIGDANAQSWLGFLYERGRGVPQDYAQAAFWYRKAAEQGNAEAQNNLGRIYDDGLGVPHDYAQAAFWYRKAAEQGNVYAQNNLGVLYADGRGVPQDYAQALFWYLKAADEQGNAEAQYELGVKYEKGLSGVPQDYAQAASWFRKAAEQGNAEAQYELGVMYEDGQGVPQDFIIAYALYNLSAAREPSSDDRSYIYIAMNNRSSLAEKMTPQQIAAGQELTRRMMKIGVLKAIDAIHPGSRAR
jgi:TPR repeat protein